MKKPDRFERLVRKWFMKIPQGKLIAIEPEVVKLLRREHAWFRWMVKKLNRYDLGRYDREDPYGVALYADGEYIRLDAVLEKLEQRRK